MTESTPGMFGVPIYFNRGRINDRLRFGSPDRVEMIDRGRSKAWFAPGKVLGFIRWRANKYGTRLWSLQVVKVVEVEALRPGVAVETLAYFRGKAQMMKALQLIDTLEKDGFDPAEVSTGWWSVMANRIIVRMPPRRYKQAQHRAVIMRRKLGM